MSVAVIGKGGAAVKVAPPVTQTQVPPPSELEAMVTSLGVVCEWNNGYDCTREHPRPAVWVAATEANRVLAFCAYCMEKIPESSTRDRVRL